MLRTCQTETFRSPFAHPIINRIVDRGRKHLPKIPGNAFFSSVRSRRHFVAVSTRHLVSLSDACGLNRARDPSIFAKVSFRDDGRINIEQVPREPTRWRLDRRSHGPRRFVYDNNTTSVSIPLSFSERRTSRRLFTIGRRDFIRESRRITRIFAGRLIFLTSDGRSYPWTGTSLRLVNGLESSVCRVTISSRIEGVREEVGNERRSGPRCEENARGCRKDARRRFEGSWCLREDRAVVPPGFIYSSRYRLTVDFPLYAAPLLPRLLFALYTASCRDTRPLFLRISLMLQRNSLHDICRLSFSINSL